MMQYAMCSLWSFAGLASSEWQHHCMGSMMGAVWRYLFTLTGMNAWGDDGCAALISAVRVSASDPPDMPVMRQIGWDNKETWSIFLVVRQLTLLFRVEAPGGLPAPSN